MPEYLERVHGVANVKKPFCVPWREDNHPSGGYSTKTYCVIDASRNEAKDIFALCGCDFGIDYFPDQVRKVAELLDEQVEECAGIFHNVKTSDKPRYEAPERKGFDEDVSDACMRACRMLLLDDGRADVKRAHEWLRRRGFTDKKSWVDFGFGFVPVFHHKDIHRSFRVKEDEAVGFVAIPHFNAKGEVHYCVLRTVMSSRAEREPNRKEWAPSAIGRPLYNEHYLNAGMDTIAVCEGPVDAISLTIMTGVPAVGLGSTSMANRFCQVLYYTKPEKRPKRVVVNMDAFGTAAEEAAEMIEGLLDEIGVDHSKLRMPHDVNDANEWLQSRAGVA